MLARNIAAVIGREGKSGGETELEPFEYETLGMLVQSLGHFDGVGRWILKSQVARISGVVGVADVLPDADAAAGTEAARDDGLDDCTVVSK